MKLICLDEIVLLSLHASALHVLLSSTRRESFALYLRCRPLIPRVRELSLSTGGLAGVGLFMQTSKSVIRDTVSLKSRH